MFKCKGLRYIILKIIKRQINLWKFDFNMNIDNKMVAGQSFIKIRDEI